MSLIINKKISFYENKTITDDMIMSLIGVVNYTFLVRKFPNFFHNYAECDSLISSKEGYIPSEINLYISNDPNEIKRDLIYILCGKEVKEEHILKLVNSTEPPNYPLQERENSIIFWIFICIILILSIVIAIYIIISFDRKGKYTADNNYHR